MDNISNSQQSCKQEVEIEIDLYLLSPGPCTLNMPKSHMSAKDAYDVFQHTAKELEECELYASYCSFIFLQLCL